MCACILWASQAYLLLGPALPAHSAGQALLQDGQLRVQRIVHCGSQGDAISVEDAHTHCTKNVSVAWCLFSHKRGHYSFSFLVTQVTAAFQVIVTNRRTARLLAGGLHAGTLDGSQGPNQGPAGTALPSTAWAGDGAHLARRVDGDVWEAEEDIALTTRTLGIVLCTVLSSSSSSTTTSPRHGL